MSNKLKRNLCFVASIIFSFVIPVLAVVIRYDMLNAYVQASTKVQISIVACIIIAIIAVCNIKRITHFINSIEFSIWKCLVSGTFKIIPLVCLVLILVNMTVLIDDLTYVAYWTLGSNIFSLFIFDPLWRYYNEETKYDIEYNARKKREQGDK